VIAKLPANWRQNPDRRPERVVDETFVLFLVRGTIGKKSHLGS
jgi:hypothetical protein